MKKIKKLIKKLNNRGSSVIMVIVSIAFVAVIVGALLSAAAYAYRLKLMNKNAKDNFYYVEQAMQEIYAGVGEKTVDQMYNAYTSTIENMVYYDLTKDTYTTLSNDEANQMFKNQFMSNINNEEYFKQSDELLAESLGNFISNSTVKIDTKALHKNVVTTTDPLTSTTTIEKIVLENITLTRTSDYTTNAGSGTYTQTVSADIEISQPDFDVNFNTTTTDYSTLFDYALIGDMGVEVNKNSDSVLKITGNIYAAADYYNKSYDAETSKKDSFVNEPATSTSKAKTSSSREFKYIAKDGTEVTYTHGSVTSKKYTGKSDTDTGLVNIAKDSTGSLKYYDGEDENSMFSGLYISNSNVSILADTVIVPGTIAVMNNSDLSIYSNENGNLTTSEVWADNIVLGGYGEKQSSDEKKTSYKAPSAYFYANMFIRDDTELNAESSDLAIKGAYFGYGDSTEKDTRVFVPTVDTDNFQYKVPDTDEDGNIKKDKDGNIVYKYATDKNGDLIKDDSGNYVYEYANRDHYNSSAIVINGQNSKLDLKQTDVLYLAGRAYIELSKNVKYNAEDGTFTSDGTTDGSVYVDNKTGQLTDSAKTNGTANTEVVTETYTYNPGTKDKDGNVTSYLSDYKTGESLAVKSTQVAYIPIILNGIPAAHEITAGTKTFKPDCVKLHPSVSGVAFFEEFFPTSVFKDGYVPVISQTVGKRTYYYYDFDTAYRILTAANASIIKTYKTADEYSAAFIKAYTDEATAEADAEAAGEEKPNDLPLNDILANDDFTSGNVVLNVGGSDTSVEQSKTTQIYSSGAITTKVDTTFSMILSNTESALTNVTTAYSELLGTTTTLLESLRSAATALDYSDAISKEYTYMKWNLGHFADDGSEAAEQEYIEALLANGWTEDMLTPINRYMMFDNISSKDKDQITPSSFELSSDYKVWVCDGDVEVGKNKVDYTDEATGVVKGMVITKGDVTFNENVKKFEGLIIAGGKIYIDGDVESITASPEICRSIIKECILVNDTKSKYVRNVFTQYRISEDGKCPVCSAKLVESVDSDGNTVKDENGKAIYTCPTEGCTYNAGATDDELLVSMENIDYTDVCSIDNWNKRVE